MDRMLDFNIADIIQIIGSAIIVYIFVVFYIRIFGKRSTSELNNFDWIVTVSMGSIFASTVILKDVSVVEGIVSILVLLFLQFIITKLTYMHESSRNIVKSTPQLLLFDGEFIEKNMKKERILKSEVYAAVRLKGLKSIKQIYAVVLETNSKISIIPNENADELGFILEGVQGLPNKLQNDLKIHKDE